MYRNAKAIPAHARPAPKHPPTDEQQAIIDAYLRGENLVIEAGAGAGKTSTLRYLGDAAPERRGIYFAYNRSIADDANRPYEEGGFPPNIKCSTAHSLAWNAVLTRGGRLGAARKARVVNPARLHSKLLAQRLGITEQLKVSEEKTLKEGQVAILAVETVGRFCQSADQVIRAKHVPFVEGMDPAILDEFRDLICDYADKVWEDILDENGTLKFEHDYYLKIWAISHPKLVGDVVMLDEAQDSNPCVAALVNEQTHMQRILVGDACQAIYGWRGAIDAMKNFDGTRLLLSQSFRFGQAVADEANKWLGYLESPLQLRGFEKIASTVEPALHPNAILCRTNAGAMNEVIAAARQGKRAALVGGGGAIAAMAKAAQELQAGRRTDHPELYLFESWADVIDYVENDAGGGDLKVFVKLVQDLGVPAILQAVDGLVNERYADVTISTAHKAKGREWDVVRIAGDFREPKEKGAMPSREEAMLAYVSVTRAKQVLDRSGLAWIDRILQEKARTNLLPSVQRMADAD